MSVTLDKCGFGCKNKRPSEFNHEHTLHGEPICEWCAGMWTHDAECCRVSLAKNLPNWKYFHNDGEKVPEYILMSRRYDNGARVSREWMYYLRNNDLHELSEFYRHG